MSADRKWEIYTLCDPREGSVRYVGVTHTGRERLNRHLGEARSGVRSRKCAWLRSLPTGVAPIFAVVESGVGTTWDAAERKWIRFYREQGAPLTNASEGGAGGPAGRKMLPRSAEHTAKLVAANVGRKASPETRAKMAAANKGREVSTETRAKISAATRGGKRRSPTAEERTARSRVLTGRPWPEARRAAEAARAAKRPPTPTPVKKKRTLSPEHKAKLSRQNIGRKHTPEARTKIAAARRGKGHPITAEQREKLSAAMRGKQFTPEHRANISASAKKRGMPPSTPELRAKQSAALKGKPWSAKRRAAEDERGVSASL